MKPVIETAMVAPWQDVHNTKVARYLVDWTGLDWTGLDWTGLDWKRDR